jgi:hypothetical protein|tara:strand:+ start:429 stop:599 length:171 start_codon:yes stop_codon:yes gene_type:complete
MADIKTITEEINTGSYGVEEKYLKNDELEDVLAIKLLKAKIDELVAEINTIKTSLE